MSESEIESESDFESDNESENDAYEFWDKHQHLPIKPKLPIHRIGCFENYLVECISCPPEMYELRYFMRPDEQKFVQIWSKYECNPANPETYWRNSVVLDKDSLAWILETWAMESYGHNDRTNVFYTTIDHRYVRIVNNNQMNEEVGFLVDIHGTVMETMWLRKEEIYHTFDKLNGKIVRTEDIEKTLNSYNDLTKQLIEL